MDRTAASHAHNSKTAGNKNIVKYLTRATTFTVPTRPYGHGQDRGFSGPMAPLVPAEARRRGGKGGGRRVVDVDQEPTSPKVSCIGQVKKHKEAWMLGSRGGDDACSEEGREEKDRNKKSNKKNASSTSSVSVVSMIFKGKVRRAEKATEEPLVAPPIGQMKRFTSGRDTLCGFDCKTNGGIVGHDADAGSSADEGEEEEEEDYGVTHSEFPTQLRREERARGRR